MRGVLAGFCVIAVFATGTVAASGCGGGDSDADRTAEERLQREEVDQAAKEAARDARQAERIRQLEKQLDDKEASTPATGAAPVLEPASWTTYTANQAGWSAEIPTGGGWADPITAEEVAGRRWRTTIDGPGRVFLIIDTTPRDVPTFDGPAQRSTVSHPIYGSVTEVVFQAADSRIADCRIGTCVDYLVPDGEGGGYGVLAGGPGHSFEELQAIAHRVMQSISYWDY